MNDTGTSKKHIAMYIGSLKKGGAEHVMVNLAEYFYSRRYHVTLVTTYIGEDEYEVPHAAWKVTKEDECGKNVVRATVVETQKMVSVDLKGGLQGGIDRVFSSPDNVNAGRIKAFRLRFDTLKNIWKELKPDLILSFIGKNNIMAILTAKSLKIPVVVSVRAKFEMEYPSKSMMMAMKYTFPKAAGIVLQSRGASQCLPDRIKKKTVVLPNSINPDFIRALYQGERDKTIVTVGRIDANKNHKLIIDSFATIKDEYPEYKLMIYGDGPDRNKLEQYVQEQKLTGRVVFEGNVSDVADRIQKAGMFVLASDMEGMPNALIEAMSLGIPCITTDCMYDTSELVQDNINGIVVPKNDKNALSGAMKMLISDSDYAAKLGAKASEIQEAVAPDVINKKWEDYFLGIIRQ